MDDETITLISAKINGDEAGGSTSDADPPDPIPASIVKNGQPYAYLGYNVKCLPCGTEFKFQLKAPSANPLNFGKSSVTYLTRVLHSMHAAEGETSNVLLAHQPPTQMESLAARLAAAQAVG